MIVNKDNYFWGDFMYDIKKDVLRTTISIDKTSEPEEAMTMYFKETKTGDNLIIMLDDTKGKLAINL
jgi:hypothetical protein